MNKKKNNLQQKILNSKLDVVKKSWHFLIAPVLVLLVGIILLCTTGFNKGIDFAGGYTFKVYVNEKVNEDVIIDDVDYYDLDVNKDYDAVYNKITNVLKKANVSLVSYQTCDMNVLEQNINNGQAVQVTYQAYENSLAADQIRDQLLATFDYTSVADWAITSIDEVPPVPSYGWAIGLTAGIVFALVAAVIYMAFRFSKSALFVTILHVALDLFLTLALLLVCRVTVNLTSGIIVLFAFVASLFNNFIFYNKVRENRTAGENLTNKDMANKVTKQTAFKKILTYVAALVVCVILLIFGSDGVRMVALGMMLSLLATFYTSTFLLPAFWALVDKPKKKKSKV